MDTRLQIVERLYEEGSENHAPHPAKTEGGEDLTREFQAISQAKFWMDHRRRRQPDPATIDRVVEAAAAASRGEIPGVVRPDRSPLRLITSPRFAMAVAATLVVAVAGLGIWRAVLPGGEFADVAALQEAELEEGLDSDFKARAPAVADAVAPREEGMRADSPDDSALLANRGPGPARARLAATAWDESDDLVRIHQRIDMLRARQSLEGWDKPVVPLERMPGGERATGIHQAGSPGN